MGGLNWGFGVEFGLNNAIMFHLRQDRVNSEVVKGITRSHLAKDSKRDYLKISPSDFADILEKKINEEGADPNSVIENYIEKRRFEDAAEFVQKYLTHEKHIEWARDWLAAVQGWMNTKKDGNQEHEAIVLSRIFTETYGPRRRRKKLREFVEENYSEQHWALILQTYYEQSDFTDYLWDLVDEGGKVWAEEMFMDVTTKQLEQLKNREGELDKIIANTDDLEHKKMANREKRCQATNSRY